MGWRAVWWTHGAGLSTSLRFQIRSRMPRHAEGGNPVECFESSSFHCPVLRFFLIIDLNQYTSRQAGINLFSPFFHADRSLARFRYVMKRNEIAVPAMPTMTDGMVCLAEAGIVTETSTATIATVPTPPASRAMKPAAAVLPLSVPGMWRSSASLRILPAAMAIPATGKIRRIQCALTQEAPCGIRKVDSTTECQPLHA